LCPSDSPLSTGILAWSISKVIKNISFYELFPVPSIYTINPSYKDYLPYTAAGEYMQGFDEKRKTMRFHMNLPIELKNGKGVTRDVSTQGVFFETDQLLSVDETVEFTIAMLYAVVDSSVRLRCQGKVLRVEPAPNGIGVAAALTSHSFENSNDVAQA